VQRKIKLKMRDDEEMAVAILLLLDSRHNRTAVRENAEALAIGFPTDGTAALKALESGRIPAGNAIIFL
jgi:hypothetical protein